jgi:MarR family transcriptional regulator, organic hydroperoxide resistance regulator
MALMGARATRGTPSWGVLWELGMRLRAHVGVIAAELDLTPTQMFALKLMAPEAPLPMNGLAERLTCDASNVTGIVDKLEARGLIQRRPDERDRRVKMLALTPRGAELRRRILERMVQPPPAIAALPAAEQRRLHETLEALLAGWPFDEPTASKG